MKFELNFNESFTRKEKFNSKVGPIYRFPLLSSPIYDEHFYINNWIHPLHSFIRCPFLFKCQWVGYWRERFSLPSETAPHSMIERFYSTEKRERAAEKRALQRLIRNNLSKQAIYKDKHGIECDWLGTIDKLYSCLSKGIGCELWTLKVRKVFWLADWLVMGIEDIRKKLHNSKLFPEHRDPCRPIFALVTRAPRRKRRKST